MCAIAGILLKPDKTLPDLAERLQAMAQVMRHRGPDDSGVYVSPDGRIGLANRRLAIRDRSPAGHMPMSNPAQTVWITYNGEIYNADSLRADLQALGYHFRSHSDTEVLLYAYEAWGEAILSRLRGMFAFAVLDRRAGDTAAHLLLARDHLGVKPLYYAQTADAFLFASELKGLLAAGLVSREISPAGLVGYLRLGSVPNPHTIYRDVVALPPAGSLRLAADRPEPVSDSGGVQTYWRLPDTETGEPVQLETAVAQVRERLAEAVRIRLVSDVPLGAFLSGGLDSSAVVALMRRATDGPIRTCAMVFEEVAYSEAPYARAVAQAVGADHYERVITAGDLLAEFDNILAALDQPTVDGVNTYFVSQTARQAGLTVALSGLGGDELFAGYPNTFIEAPQVYRALRLAQAIPGGATLARAALGRLPTGRRAQWARLAEALAQPATPAGAYLARRGLFTAAETQALLSPEIWWAARSAFDPAQHIAAQAGANGAMSMNWLSRAELRTYTHHQLLRDTDAMSMAHSLEVRVPLLDVRLVDYVLRLPAAVKRNGRGEVKPLLQRALSGSLPALVTQRQEKQGFTFPFAPWLRGEGLLRERAQALLAEVQGRPWLRPAPAYRVWAEVQAGRLHWSRLWALLALAAVVGE